MYLYHRRAEPWDAAASLNPLRLPVLRRATSRYPPRWAPGWWDSAITCNASEDAWVMGLYIDRGGLGTFQWNYPFGKLSPVNAKTLPKIRYFFSPFFQIFCELSFSCRRKPGKQ